MKYMRNYLRSVIVRVDFLAPVLDMSKSLPETLQNAIIRDFPVPERQEIQVQFGPISIVRDSSPRKTIMLDFYTGNRTGHLGIGTDFLFIEESSYSGYDALSHSFLSVLGELLALSSEQPATRRLGLRYQNVIPAPGKNPLDWTGYIDSKLLLAISHASMSNPGLCRAMTYLEFNDSDARFIFQYGIPNQDYPAPIRRKEFILDFDSFVTGVVERQQLANTLNDLHSRVETTFETAILAKLRKAMARDE